MLRGISLAVAVLACWGGWLAAAPAPGLNPDPSEKVPLPCYGLLLATVRDGVVYTVSGADVEGFSGVRLWEAPLRTPAEGKHLGTSRTFRGWHYATWVDRLHWHIAYDHIWAECGGGSIVLCYQIALEDLPLLDIRNGAGAAALRKKYGDEDSATAAGFLTLQRGFGTA